MNDGDKVVLRPEWKLPYNIWPPAHFEFICACQICDQELLPRSGRSPAGLWYHQVNQPITEQDFWSPQSPQAHPFSFLNVSLLSSSLRLYTAVERRTTLWPRGWATPGCWPVRTSSSSCVGTRRTWTLTERSRSWRLHASLRRTVGSTVCDQVAPQFFWNYCNLRLSCKEVNCSE